MCRERGDHLHNFCNFIPGRLRYAAGFGPASGPAESFVKTYNIEIQRVKSMRHDQHGLVHAQIDALVQTVTARDEGEPSSVISMTEANARVLLSLIKAQLLELDKRKARSRF